MATTENQLNLKMISETAASFNLELTNYSKYSTETKIEVKKIVSENEEELSICIPDRMVDFDFIFFILKKFADAE